MIGWKKFENFVSLSRAPVYKWNNTQHVECCCCCLLAAFDVLGWICKVLFIGYNWTGLLVGRPFSASAQSSYNGEFWLASSLLALRLFDNNFELLFSLFSEFSTFVAAADRTALQLTFLFVAMFSSMDFSTEIIQKKVSSDCRLIDGIPISVQSFSRSLPSS